MEIINNDNASSGEQIVQDVYYMVVPGEDPGTRTISQLGPEHLPAIYRNGIDFDADSNRYLADRFRTGYTSQKADLPRKQSLPTLKALRTTAHMLANFLEYQEAAPFTLQTCEYGENIVKGYQAAMAEGTFSASGKPLSSHTVNPRVAVACDYLSWLAETGRRGPFHIPYRTFPFKVAERSGRVVTRVGAVREGTLPRTPLPDLVLPSRPKIQEWLWRMDQKHGPAIELMCKSIPETALRLEELVCLRTNVLPNDESEWRISDPLAPMHRRQVQIDVEFGVKGREFGYDHGDKVGMRQSIWIPYALAKQWATYRDTIRPLHLKQWVSAAGSRAERTQRIANSVHLFLRPDSGERFRGPAFYRLWTSVERPSPRWCPKYGRHWWACMTLLDEIRRTEAFMKSNGVLPHDYIGSLAGSVIDLKIRPQLRHVDKETTQIYLRWLTSVLYSGTAIAYSEELDSLRSDD